MHRRARAAISPSRCWPGAPSPPHDLSAMDGYAVCAGDLAGPWKVIGESAAGHPYSGTVEPGKAARISTGAAAARGGRGDPAGRPDARWGWSAPHRRCPLARSTSTSAREGMDFREGEQVLSRRHPLRPGTDGARRRSGAPPAAGAPPPARRDHRQRRRTGHRSREIARRTRSRRATARCSPPSPRTSPASRPARPGGRQHGGPRRISPRPRAPT